ncbi:hypothetical protein DIPPA_05997 [Diplonema papillatum]|nr:hypothetical protein DIPPA_05997 [Diplonema papillatum]
MTTDGGRPVDLKPALASPSPRREVNRLLFANAHDAEQLFAECSRLRVDRDTHQKSHEACLAACSSLSDQVASLQDALLTARTLSHPSPLDLSDLRHDLSQARANERSAQRTVATLEAANTSLHAELRRLREAFLAKDTVLTARGRSLDRHVERVHALESVLKEADERVRQEAERREAAEYAVGALEAKVHDLIEESSRERTRADRAEREATSLAARIEALSSELSAAERVARSKLTDGHLPEPLLRSFDEARRDAAAALRAEKTLRSALEADLATARLELARLSSRGRPPEAPPEGGWRRRAEAAEAEQATLRNTIEALERALEKQTARRVRAEESRAESKAAAPPAKPTAGSPGKPKKKKTQRRQNPAAAAGHHPFFSSPALRAGRGSTSSGSENRSEYGSPRLPSSRASSIRKASLSDTSWWSSIPRKARGCTPNQPSTPTRRRAPPAAAAQKPAAAGKDAKQQTRKAQKDGAAAVLAGLLEKERAAAKRHESHARAAVAVAHGHRKAAFLEREDAERARMRADRCEALLDFAFSAHETLPTRQMVVLLQGQAAALTALGRAFRKSRQKLRVALVNDLQAAVEASYARGYNDGSAGAKPEGDWKAAAAKGSAPARKEPPAKAAEGGAGGRRESAGSRGARAAERRSPRLPAADLTLSVDWSAAAAEDVNPMQVFEAVLRKSPATEIAAMLVKHGLQVVACSQNTSLSS